MLRNLTDIFTADIRAPDSLRGPLVIYGAGNTGKAVCQYVRGLGYKVSGFIDAGATPGQVVEGLPVWPPNGLPKTFCLKDHAAIVAIHNYTVPMAPLLSQLSQWGFRQILTMVDFVNLFPDGQPTRFWLAPRMFYTEHVADIGKLLDLLADDLSREHVLDILKLRFLGDYGALGEPMRGNQYAPVDVPRWRNPVRLVDCGAYHGEAIGILNDNGYVVESAVMFEPDLDNYNKLVGSIVGCSDSICFPCGVYSENRMFRFNSGQGMGSHLSETGENHVICVRLDDAIPDFEPTIIKMDIEGAEIDALDGARKIIKKYRPGLAVSIYHTPGHLWEIPNLIHEMGLDYSFYVRCHEYSSFESVLYALQR